MGSDAVVVTGASTGIGRACALDLARRGMHVFAGVRRESDGAALEAAATGRLTPLFLDVTDEAQVYAAAKTVEAVVGSRGLRGVVNNAGVALATPLEFVELDELRHQLEVNVVGAVAVTQAFLPAIRQAVGRVVFVGSTNGFLSPPLMGPYSASKFALEAISDAFRQELGCWGIQVALVEPGTIATPIWEKSEAEAEARLGRLPAEARKLYDPLIAPLQVEAKKRAAAATPVEGVAKVVAHALTAERPRTRYRVGGGAHTEWILARWLPDRLRDRIVMRFLGMPRGRLA